MRVNLGNVAAGAISAGVLTLFVATGGGVSQTVETIQGQEVTTTLPAVEVVKSLPVPPTTATPTTLATTTTTVAVTTTTVPPGPRPKYVIGDSLTVGVDLANFQEIAVEIDLNLVEFSAKEGRRTSQAIDIVQSWGELPEDAVVLVALGTNDVWVGADTFRTNMVELLEVIGERDVVWVDVSENIPGDEDAINDVIAEVADSASNVSVGDWSAFETANNVKRAADGVHYNISQYAKRVEFYNTLLQSYDN